MLANTQERFSVEWFLSGAPQLFCGFVIGFLIAYSGIGGGALIIPAMIVFFGISPVVAVGTASVFAVITKIAAARQHWKIGNINLKLSATFTAAAAPGVLLSAVLVNYFSQAGGESFQTFLRYSIVAAIILSLLAAQYRPQQRLDERRGLLMAAAFAVGLVMGATGVGGGVLIVPTLFLLSREEPKGVVGASIIIALVLSALTALAYGGGGQVDYALAAWMTAGAMLAMPLAMRCLQKSSQKFVQRVVTFLIFIALVLIVWG